MMGRRSDQGSLFGAQQHYLDLVGRESFYGWLAAHGRQLFRDEEFTGLYCAETGRPSVPPSLLCLALLLQTHDRVSDAEAKQRADFDLRWKVALGIDLDERPFAKSTLQLFRAQLVIHEQAQSLFRRSLEVARAQGYVKGRQMRAALDTTIIFGRGAVEDTYNLIAHGIQELCRVLAAVAGEEPAAWAQAHDLGRYFAPSIKGAVELDWDDAASREAFLTEIIAEGERALALAREVRSEVGPDSPEDRRIAAAAELLTQLLWQDVEPTDRGYRVKPGTAQGRVPSVHDPEQRHGHKSRGRSFTGHKAAVAVDTESQLITAVEVLLANESDGESAAALIASSEADTGSVVEQVIGDTAYGSMETREALGACEVIAPTVKGHHQRPIGKDDFTIDVEHDRVVCPQGHETCHWTWVGQRSGRGKPAQRTKRFAFPKEVCRACPRYADCVQDQRRRGRFVQLHPDEARLQAARALEQTDYFREQYRQRVVIEHRIARLLQLGIRQSRYFGRAKTRFQVLMAATVANLTLLASQAGPEGGLRHLATRLRSLWRPCRSLLRRWGVRSPAPIQTAA